MNKIINKVSYISSFYKILYDLTLKVKTTKLSYLIFLFILIFSALFEISILGLLFVLIKAFMDPNYYQGNFLFKFFLNIFDIRSNSQLVIYLSIFFILATFTAGFFRVAFFYLLSKYVYFFGKNITSLCYQKVIYDDYSSLYQKNTNDTLSIFNKMPIINNSFFNSLLMIYNLVNFIFIFSILAYINFQITVISSLFFISLYLCVIFFFKKKIFNNATIISNEQATNIKIVRETFNGFRDILINNYQKFYNNLFLKSYSSLSRGNEENRFFYTAPKPIIETFLLVGIGVVISLHSNNYSALENLLPNIAVLAVASQRILPILNQLYAGHMANVDATPQIMFIFNFLKKPIKIKKKKNLKKIKFKSKISLKNVSFSYNSSNKLVLKNINLIISAGSRVGIIGKSGSGKSTLADLILGLLNPNSGEISVDRKPIINEKENWFSCVASVPQNIFITEQTISENIAFGVNKNKINMEEVKKSSNKAELSDFIENRENRYNNIIGEKGLKISAGQRQRLAIARALYKKSKLIIFDEATSSLDSESEKNVLNTIFSLSRRRHTLIIITHKLSNLKRCDHIYKIQNSKIIKFK